MASYDEIYARVEERKRAQISQEASHEAMAEARAEVDRLNVEVTNLYAEADQKRNEAEAKRSEATVLAQEIENRQPAPQEVIEG